MGRRLDAESPMTCFQKLLFFFTHRRHNAVEDGLFERTYLINYVQTEILLWRCKTTVNVKRIEHTTIYLRDKQFKIQ